MKIAVLFIDGFEELEALGIVDMARRLSVTCHMVGVHKMKVVGSHDVQIKMDMLLENLDNTYDALVLPGGPGALDLKDDLLVLDTVKKYNQASKVIAAICAAPTVLEKAGLLKGKTITCHPSVVEMIKEGHYIENVTHVDGRIVTGNGPAATFEFAFKILESLGYATSDLRISSQYNYLINKKD